MNLSYRGTTYSTNPAQIETVDTEQSGIFLGASYSMKQHNVAQRSATSAQLQYRGISYHR